jgi:hypothetical protein
VSGSPRLAQFAGKATRSVPASQDGIARGLIEPFLLNGAAPESNRASLELPDLTGFGGLPREVHLATGAAFRRRSDSLGCAEVRSGRYQIGYQVGAMARRRFAALWSCDLRGFLTGCR